MHRSIYKKGALGAVGYTMTRFSKLCPTIIAGIITYSLRVIHKICLQEEVGRWSQNVHFLSTFIPYKISIQGVGGKKNPKSCQLKGQLISKANCQAEDSSKKQTNEFVSTSMRRFFVRFLGESSARKKRLEIY